MMDFAFDILLATEAASVASSAYIGCGDKEQADAAATEAMRKVLNDIDGFGAVVVLGEGAKDNAPMLHNGEVIGTGDPAWDIAVDPLDGTTQTAKGGPGAMSVIAVGNRNSLFSTDAFYMNKLVYGPKLGRAIDGLRRPRFGIETELGGFLSELNTELMRVGGPPLTACLLDRPRNAEATATFHRHGWRVRLIQDCDVSAAIATCLPDSGVDLYYGVGGSPEGVLAAAAVKCLGGHIEAVLVDHKTFRPVDGRVLRTEDLAAGDVIFSATGVTDGHLLRGVRGSRTHSVLMYSKTQRAYWIKADRVG